MALQVWLPLNGNLRNQGISGTTVTNSGATVDNSGKIGKCYSFSSSYLSIPNPITTTTNAFSISTWVYITAYSSGYACIASSRTATSGKGIALWVTSSTIRVDDGEMWSPSYSFQLNTWTHITIAWSTSGKSLYVNGNLIGTKATVGTLANLRNTLRIAGDEQTGTTYLLKGKLNDFRIYDHCLSQKEVKEIAKGLVLHYKLDDGFGGENLFLASPMNAQDRNGWTSNSGTDWTKHLRFYNGSASIHTFTGGVVCEDTVLLNSSGNLGISFVRSASEISLSSSDFYTISCEAKCTKAGKSLCIGLSYYSTSNSWVWRGGTNGTAFATANEWQKFTLTFKPDADTKYICYCFTVTGASGGTDTFTIRHCKLEKGTKATVWSPSPSDSAYSDLGISKANDCSGYGYNGTVVGTLTDSSDTPRYHKSTGFTYGKNYHIVSPSINKSEMQNSYSVSWWSKSSNMNGRMAWGSVSGNRLNLYPTGSYFCWNTGDGASNVIKNGSTSIAFAQYQGDWHHYVMTGDGTDGKLYIDGEYIGKATTYKPFTSDIIYLSGWDGSTSYTWDGNISDFRIYATALSANDVKELYNTSAYIYNDGTVSAYEFDEEYASTGPDIRKSGVFASSEFIEDSDTAKFYSDKIKATQIMEV